MSHSLFHSNRPLLALVGAFMLMFSAEVANAVDAAMGESACSVLRAVLPKVKGFKPEGARAQLVMAMAEKFDYDGKKLKQLQVEVDSAASARCSKERDAWLALLGSKSLEVALR